ncbi:MAG: hypothetical protein AAF682_24080 [Planctomycetota bacterium]
MTRLYALLLAALALIGSARTAAASDPPRTTRAVSVDFRIDVPDWRLSLQNEGFGALNALERELAADAARRLGEHFPFLRFGVEPAETVLTLTLTEPTSDARRAGWAGPSRLVDTTLVFTLRAPDLISTRTRYTALFRPAERRRAPATGAVLRVEVRRVLERLFDTREAGFAGALLSSVPLGPGPGRAPANAFFVLPAERSTAALPWKASELGAGPGTRFRVEVESPTSRLGTRPLEYALTSLHSSDHPARVGVGFEGGLLAQEEPLAPGTADGPPRLRDAPGERYEDGLLVRYSNVTIAAWRRDRISGPVTALRP